MALSRPLVSGVAGLALGAAGTLAITSSSAPPPAVVLVAESEDRPPSEPVRATLAPAPPAPPSPPAPVDRAALLELDVADWIANGAGKIQKNRNELTHSHLWPTIALAYARLARPDDVRRACEAGLAAGGDVRDCTAAISELPEKQRVVVFEALRARHPDLVWDPMLVLKVAVSRGDTDAAFSAALALFREGKQGAVPAFLEMARLDPARAARAAEELRDPPSAWLTQIAQSFAQAGARALAAEWAARAKARAGEEFARVQAQAAEQRRALRARAGRDPRDAQSWAELAQVLEGDGDRVGAADAHRHAVEIDPFLEDEWRALARLDPAAAIPMLARAAERVARDSLWIELAKACLRLGRGAEAMDAFENVHSDDIEGWWEAGFARAAPVRALAWLEERLRIARFAEQDSYVRARAEALEALGRRDEAWRACERFAMEGDEEWAWAVLVLADPARTLEAAEARFREDPQLHSASRVRADALRRLGRREEAVKAYERWDADGDEEAVAALAALGSQDALQRLEKYQQEDPGDYWNALRLAEAYRSLHREADARKALVRADAAVESDDVVWWTRRWFPR